MATTRRRIAAPAPAPRWLDDRELGTWRSVARLMAHLPAALERQLQRDARLSYLEYYVLAGLSEQPDRSMQICRLASMVDAELSRMSHLVKRLERRGLVRREPDPTDRRSTLAVLTTAGQTELAAAAPPHVDCVRDLVIDALDSEELEVFENLCNRIVARIARAD